MTFERNLILNKYLVVSILLALLLVFFGSIKAHAATGEKGVFYGNWNSDFFLKPIKTSPSSPSFTSTLSLTYGISGVDFSSRSVFTTTDDNPSSGSFHRQKFGLDSRIGIMDFGSDLVYFPEDARMEYWITDASTTLGGFTITDTLLIEYTVKDIKEDQIVLGYGAGTEVTVQGKSSNGTSVELSNRFGMEEAKKEQEGIEEGSGYDIVTDGAQGPITYPPSSFQYVSSTFEISNSSFDCCKFDSTTEFSREEGFISSEFEFTMESENLPLLIDTDIKFKPKEKTVSLDPELIFEDNCFDLYVDFREKDTSTYDLEFKGIGLRGIKLGDFATLSDITALNGSLHRYKGTKDIKLRAGNYLIDPITPEYYTELTEYDQVLSIISSQERLTLLAGDFYFKMNDSDLPLGVKKFTGEARYSFEDGFELGTGVSITQEKIESFMVEVDLSF